MEYTINGRRIELNVVGEGKRDVLLVHGLGGSSNFWSPVLPVLAKKYRSIVPDLPSSARSTADPDLSIESICNDLFELLDKCDADSVDLMGHSMGTIVCQHMATLAPERISKLILLGPLGEPPDAARPALMDRAALARADGMAPIAEAIVNGGLSEVTRNSRPVAVGFVREVMMAQDPEAYAQSCIALSKAQKAPPEGISCPTLLITGADDATAPPSRVTELAGAMPNARLEVLPECGHWTATEKPQEVAQLVSDFMAHG